MKRSRRTSQRPFDVDCGLFRARTRLVGPATTWKRTLTHVGRLTGTTCDDLAPFDGGVIQHHTTQLLQAAYPGYITEPTAAETVDDAVLLHGGEATRARDRFAGLEANQRAALMAYLNTL